MSGFVHNQELDFNEARADLDSVLQNIVAKANAGDGSGETEAGVDESDSGSMAQSHQDSRGKLPLMDFDSPRKAGGKSARKRKRKEDLKEEKHKANSCVMKLFDRSVDLAKFSEDTPLYPICRSWMMNDPYKEKPPLSMNSKNSAELIYNGCAVVPPPDKPFNNFQNDGMYVSPRIPTPPPQPSDNLESYLRNEKTTPRAESLLLNHLQHWKAVRERWRKKSVQNETRYETGMSMLQEMASRPLFNSLPS